MEEKLRKENEEKLEKERKENEEKLEKERKENEVFRSQIAMLQASMARMTVQGMAYKFSIRKPVRICHN